MEPGLLALARGYRKSLQVRVDSAQTLYNIGSAYIQTGDYPKAAGYLELAKSLRPGDSRTLNNLAVEYAKSGRVEDAVEELESLLEAAPGDLLAARNLELFQQAALPVFIPRLKERFPALAEKWRRLEGLRYEENENGVSPFVGYRGSAQAAGELKSEERAALDALVLREGPAAPKPPIFPRSYSESREIYFGDLAVEVRPVAARPSKAKVQDGVILYPRAYAHASVFLAASAGEMEEFYYLESPEAPKVFRQELRPRGRIKSFRVNGGGELEALDSTGGALLRLSKPRVFDAAGRESFGRFDLESGAPRERFLLALSFDDSGLEYPLLIDPACSRSTSKKLSF
ncbi:MAG: tetratricopeptide repeat protein, partial [Chloroflexota bacterium]